MKLVMDDAALGDVSAASDAEIVTRAAHLPVAHVVIVRVFEGTAVVTAYQLDGTAVAGVSVAPQDEQVASNPAAGEGASKSGTTKEAWEAVGEVLSDPENAPEKKSPIQDEYEKRKVRVLAPLMANGAIGMNATTFFKGSTRVTGRDVWLAIEREDLAEKYDQRRKTKLAATVLSGAVMVGGILLMVPYAANPGCLEADSSGICYVTKEPGPVFYTGVIAALAGFTAVIMVPLSYNPHPHNASETVMMYDDYNTKLRRELELSENEPFRLEPPEVDIVPVRGGAGLGATWTW